MQWKKDFQPSYWNPVIVTILMCGLSLSMEKKSYFSRNFLLLSHVSVTYDRPDTIGWTLNDLSRK